MGKHSKQLSVTERAVMDVINKFPGLLPHEIGTHLQGILKPDSVSACTSRLVLLRKVNRTKVAHTSTFRYYPLNHPLPKDVQQWDNTLVVVTKRMRKAPTGEALNNEHVRAAVSPPKDERQIEMVLPPSPKPKVALLTIEGIANTSYTWTIEEARFVWEQLQQVFASK